MLGETLVGVPLVGEEWIYTDFKHFLKVLPGESEEKMWGSTSDNGKSSEWDKVEDAIEQNLFILQVVSQDTMLLKQLPWCDRTQVKAACPVCQSLLWFFKSDLNLHGMYLKKMEMEPG